jgi:N-methylhydantoinase A
VYRVVNENMAGAARMHAIERGRDISRCTLVATGGAGPVHAWGVARGLGVRTLVFPPLAGVASAFGMLTATRAFDFVRSMPSPLPEVAWDEVRAAIAELAADGERMLTRAGARAHVISTALAADVRHRGQGEAITVALGAELGPDPARQVEDAFEAAYVSLYQRRPPGVEAEVLSWRLRMSGPAPEIAAEPHVDDSDQSESRRSARRRPIWSPEAGGMVDAEVLWRSALRAGDIVCGPAVVQEAESTVVIGVGGTGRVEDCGALVVEIDG